MPHYNTLPQDIQDGIDSNPTAEVRIEVIYDPDGQNVPLAWKHDIVDISPIVNIRDMDIEWTGRPTAYDMVLTFHDPDDYFNPTNSESPFYNCVGELQNNYSTGATTIRLLDKSGVSFSAGKTVQINDGTNSQDLIVKSFTAAAGSTYYHSMEFTSALSSPYKAGTRIFAKPNEKTEVLVRLHLVGTTDKITCYRGRLLKDPECINGKGILTLVDLKKYNLDEAVIGADTSSANKLKRMNTSGTLADSVVVSSGAGVTLDRSKVVVLDNAKLDSWTATFSSATDFTLKGSEISEGVSSQIDLETVGALIGTSYPFYIGYVYDVAIYKNYLLFANGGDNENAVVVIVDISNKQNPTHYGSFGGYGAPNYMNGVVKLLVVDNYLYMISQVDEMFVIYDMSDINNPFIVSSLTNIINSTDSSSGMTIDGNYAYVVSYTNDALYVVDITDKTNPTLIGTFSGAGAPNYMEHPGRGIDKQDDYIYLGTNDSDGALVVINVSDPTTPTLADVIVHGSPPGDQLKSVHDIVVNGNYAYTITNNYAQAMLTVWNISDPTNVTYVTDISGDGAPEYLNSSWTMNYRDNRIYIVSAADNALTIFDVSDPLNISHVDAITGIGSPIYLETPTTFILSGDYAYIGTNGSSARSVTVVRISTSDTNTVGKESIRIPADAWGGTPADGEIVTFATAINFDSVNVAQALYSLYVTYGGIDNNLLGCSSYFGDKQVGTLQFPAAKNATSIKVKVTVPTILKAAETLTITEGSTTEDVTISVGTGTQNQYPEYISLTISALAHSYTTAATVTWKQRATLDIDFNWDAEYNYFDQQDYNISLSLDRSMNYLQAIEEVSRHGDCFTFTDNWGVEKIHTFRPHYFASVPTYSKSTNLAQPDPELESFPLVNQITINYGYNHLAGEYLYQYIFPESLEENHSYSKNGFIRNKTINLTGAWTQEYVEKLARRKYAIWSNGLQGVFFNTTMQGLLLNIGDRIAIDSDEPTLDTELEIIGITGMRYTGALQFEFLGYDAEFLWNNYFLINSSGIATGRVLW